MINLNLPCFFFLDFIKSNVNFVSKTTKIISWSEFILIINILGLVNITTNDFQMSNMCLHSCAKYSLEFSSKKGLCYEKRRQRHSPQISTICGKMFLQEINCKELRWIRFHSMIQPNTNVKELKSMVSVTSVVNSTRPFDKLDSNKKCWERGKNEGEWVPLIQPGLGKSSIICWNQLNRQSTY